MYNRPFFDNIKKFFLSRNALSRLIIINIIVFIAANLVNLLYFLFKIPPDISSCGLAISKFSNLFAVPSNYLLLLEKPWTIFTYMFLQEDFFHILFNMIMLYFGGSIFLQFFGAKKLISTYILGGISGAAFYIFAFNFFPVFSEVSKCSLALGASASVLAILVAIAAYVPDYSVVMILFGRIRLKYIALFLVIIDILSIDKENSGGHIAHLGGALMGFFYIFSLKKKLFHFSFFNKLITSIKKIFKPKTKLKVEYKKKGRPLTDDEFTKLRADNQKKMDGILDKISKSGYDSLTTEEKGFLFSASNKR